MMSNTAARVHVLVLHDDIPGAGERAGEHARSEALLASEPKFRLSVERAGYGEAVRVARFHCPDVVLLDGVLGDPVELVAALDEALPDDTPLLVVLDEAERDRAHDCVVAGARLCLVRPLEPSALVRTVGQLHARSARRRKQLQTGVDNGGRLVAVRGAKGGVGTTFVATNLAVAVKRLTDQRVALVDASFFGGDVPAALNLAPERSLADLIPHLHMLDDDLLASTLVRHTSGVDVLAAPVELERAEAITAEDFQRVLEALRARYDYVVVDCAPSLDRNSLTTLDLADLVLLVSTPEVAALKNASRFLQVGAGLGYSPAKIRLVVNRLNCLGAIKRADFEKHLEYRMNFGIPNDRSVLRALMHGEPLVSSQRTSRAARAVEKLARAVVADQGWEGEAKHAMGRRLRVPMPSFSRLGALGRRPGSA